MMQATTPVDPFWNPAPKLSQPAQVDPYADNYTSGDYATEADSVRAFDELAAASGMFNIYREVTGRMQHLHIGQEGSGRVRIDRILQPTAQLVEAGWNLGFVGVECKRSGEKIGRPVSQMIDYVRSAWNVGNGIEVMLSHVFLWPHQGCGGPIASVMAQQRLGVAWRDRDNNLTLCAGGNIHLATIGAGTVTFNRQPVGRKVGSR